MVLTFSSFIIIYSVISFVLFAALIAVIIPLAILILTDVVESSSSSHGSEQQCIPDPALTGSFDMPSLIKSIDLYTNINGGRVLNYGGNANIYIAIDHKVMEGVFNESEGIYETQLLKIHSGISPGVDYANQVGYGDFCVGVSSDGGVIATSQYFRPHVDVFEHAWIMTRDVNIGGNCYNFTSFTATSHLLGVYERRGSAVSDDGSTAAFPGDFYVSPDTKHYFIQFFRLDTTSGTFEEDGFYSISGGTSLEEFTVTSQALSPDGSFIVYTVYSKPVSGTSTYFLWLATRSSSGWVLHPSPIHAFMNPVIDGVQSKLFFDSTVGKTGEWLFVISQPAYEEGTKFGAIRILQLQLGSNPTATMVATIENPIESTHDGFGKSFSIAGTDCIKRIYTSSPLSRIVYSFKRSGMSFVLDQSYQDPYLGITFGDTVGVLPSGDFMTATFMTAEDAYSKSYYQEVN